MARIAEPLSINEETYDELVSLSRGSKIAHRYVIRSRIILKLYEGKSYDQVQQELSVGRQAVAKWKSRFLQSGIEGLMDKKGRGAKPKYKD